MPTLDLNLLAWISLGVVLLIVSVQTVSVTLFVRQLLGFSRLQTSDDSLPAAAVVLSIRGPDPFLEGTIESLLRQDYPRLLISIVLDDARDPARQMVESVIAREGATNIRISVLNERRSTCSLKCSSLIQAVKELPREYDVVAFIDGDAKPHPQWLRDLVTPLQDPLVGVSTGNRWYMPTVGNWGSLVRYFWNAGAVVQVWFNDLVWAGSMALRRETIERIDLLEAWGTALSVDATVHRQLRKHKLKVKFAPSVMLVNSEHISLSAFSGWVRRQLVAARYCSEGWAIVMLHGLVLAASQLLAGTVAVVAGVSGNWLALCTSLAALGIYWTASVKSAAALEMSVRRIARLNGQPVQWLNATTLFKLLPAMLLTHFAYVIDLLAASRCRRVSWRGVDYTLGRNHVRMVSYHPYCDVAGSQRISSVV